MNNNDVVKALNDLIETSKDGEMGFDKSADQVKNSELKALFKQRAAECRQSASELQAQVTQYGGSPQTGGSTVGALHRTWVQVRGSISTLSDHAVLEECERGEDHALARYRAALKEELPATLMTLVERQLQGVQRNHDQIKSLRDKLPK
ncbi:MAG: aldehyde dehydrogenase [Rhizobacter sp.]|nr:aldehyde dehydrogenase [Rhizobacter sp.]